MEHLQTTDGTEITLSQSNVEVNDITEFSPVATFADFFTKHPQPHASALVLEYDNASPIMREFVLRELRILQKQTEETFGKIATDLIVNRLNESGLLVDIMNLYDIKSFSMHYDSTTQKFGLPKIGIVSERGKRETKGAGKSAGVEYYVNGNYVGGKSISLSDHLGIKYDSWHGINRMLEIAKYIKKSDAKFEVTREIDGKIETFDVSGTIENASQMWI